MEQAGQVAKYAFLMSVFLFVLFVLAQVVSALGRAAAVGRAGPREASGRAPAAPGAFLQVGDHRVGLSPRRELLIGRAPDCGLVLQDTFISQQHARVRWTGNGWSLTDLGSTNGTRVNGQSVDEVLLRDGDRIEMGGSVVVFRQGA